MPGIRQTYRNLSRLRQITSIAARHGLSHLLNKDKPTSTDGQEKGSIGDQHPSNARRFRMLLQDLGATFIKFGQILSTRPDLLSPQLVHELSYLQDHVQAMDSDQVLEQVQMELNASADELFDEFELIPIASASIAQVHRAKLKNGQPVAIKIQRPNLLEQIEADLDILYYLAKLMEAIVEESGYTKPARIVEEFEKAFLGELDFAQEATTIEKFYDNAVFRQSYLVPRVFRRFSTKKILVMEYMDGVSIKEIKDPGRRRELAETLIDAAFDQIFIDGLFHADPHPGNILVTKNNQLVLLDFGNVGEISTDMKNNLIDLLLSIALQDADSLTRVITRSTQTIERVNIRELREDCSYILFKHINKRPTLQELTSKNIIEEVVNVTTKHKLRLPIEYSLGAKAAISIEGIIRDFHPELNILEKAAPYLKKIMVEKFNPKDITTFSMKRALQLSGYAHDIPLSLNQILHDLENQCLRIEIANKDIEDINKGINALGVVIFMGLVASAFISGSFYLFAQYKFDIFGIPVFSIAGLAIAGLLFGGALGKYLLHGRIKKISIGKWTKTSRRKKR